MDYYNQLSEHFESPWAKLAVAVAVGVLAGAVLAAILGLVGRWFSRKYIKDSIASTRTFAFVICIVASLKVGVLSFGLDEEILAEAEKGLTFAIFVLITWAFDRVFMTFNDSVIAEWGRKNDSVTLTQVGSTVARVMLWIIGLVAGLNTAGYNVMAALAGLGISGIALALAAQDAVANIFGGVVVLTQSPFRVGDKITVRGTTGWVDSIGIRSTIITTWTGHTVTIPNKVFTDTPVENIDTRTEYWENWQLKLRHDTSIEQIEKAIGIVKAQIAAHEHIFEKAWVGMCNVGEGFVEIEIWYGILVWKEEDSEEFFNFYAKQLGVKSDFMMRVLKALEQEEIPLATPVQGIVMYQDMKERQSRF